MNAFVKFIFTIILFSLPFITLAETNPFNSYTETPRYSWEGPYESYKYNSIHFRLLRPNNYVQHTPGKKYALMVFFHGAGEKGDDNSKQLKHGAQMHMQQVQAGNYDAFLLYPQLSAASSGVEKWNSYTVKLIIPIIDELIKNFDVDPARITTTGLSNGGVGVTSFFQDFNIFVAAAVSCSYNEFSNNSTVINQFKYSPFWIGQGGSDRTGGALARVGKLRIDSYRDTYGANIRHVYFPTAGHGIWNQTWAKPEYIPFMRNASKLNIMVLYGNQHYYDSDAIVDNDTVFQHYCAGETINFSAGVSPGYADYEWMKDGVLMSGINTNSINVTSVGEYKVRFKWPTTYQYGSSGTRPVWPEYSGQWTAWSEPLVVDYNRVLSPPVIINDGGKSVNLPALDGSSTVELLAPDGMNNYIWKRDGTTVQSSANVSYTVNIGGGYTVSVNTPAEDAYFIDDQSDWYNNDGIPETNLVPAEYRPERQGCYSTDSNVITVTTENGPDSPFAPVNFFVYPQNITTAKVIWDDNSDNELNFELYRSVDDNTNYTLIAKIGSKSQSNNPQEYFDEGLVADKTYYYRMRAVNDNGGSAYTPERSITTVIDVTPPIAPILSTGLTSRLSIELHWSGATDNVGVKEYDIFMNGSYLATTSDTTYDVLGLVEQTVYSFQVKAKDDAGNISPFSNQVSAATINTGLYYKYYHQSGLSSVDNIETVGTFIKSGSINNFDISVRDKDTYYALIYQGFINIPTDGTYTFYTSSDDGSKLYIDGQQIVNNDGNHGTRERNGSIYLDANSHSIEVRFYQGGGGYSLSVKWQGPGISKQLIPDSVLKDSFTYPQPPASPSNVQATAISYDKVNLTWQDNSADETGFEIYRSVLNESNYILINTTAANVISFLDSGLSGSTLYYYKVVAINQNGSSASAGVPTELSINFNNNVIDESGNSISLTVNGNPIYSTDAKEGSQSLLFDGVDDDIQIGSSSEFIYQQFNTRSVAFWMKPNTTNTQIILDEGGGTNGLAIYKDNTAGGTLYFAVRNGGSSSQQTISTTYNINQWTHIVCVFDNGAMKLYKAGVLVSTGTASFSTVSSHSSTAGIGDDFGGNAMGNSGIGNYSGLLDQFKMYSTSLSQSEITAIMNNVSNVDSVTTDAAPSPPGVPTNLVITPLSTSVLRLDWQHSDNNETVFNIYRTTSALNVGWTLIAQIPTTNSLNETFTDSGLTGNSTFYYKVSAEGIGGESGFSSIQSASTLNTAPVFDNLIARSVKFNTVLQLDINVTDSDGDLVSITTDPLPSFASFIDNANNTGLFTFSPSSSDGGTYNLVLRADDGTDQTVGYLNITVSDNDNPVIDPISDVYINEGSNYNVSINSIDVNPGQVPTLSVINLPSFAQFIDNGDGTGQITINTSIGDFGSYTVTITADDGAGGIGVEKFKIIISKAILDQRIYINFSTSSVPYNTAPWYNHITNPSGGAGSATALIDSLGATTGISISWDTGDEKSYSLTTQGVYPIDVMRAHWLKYGDMTFTIHNLSPALKYNFTVFGWTAYNNPTTRYKVGTQEVELSNQQNDLNQTGVLTGLVSDSNGDIVLNVQKVSGRAVIGSLIIESYYDNGLPPLAPTLETLVSNVSTEVDLIWTDNSSTETKFEVWRSLASSGPFTKAGETGKNVIQYTDTGLSGNTVYYYKVKAINNNGSSESAVKSVRTKNGPPQFANLSDIQIFEDQHTVINISATDQEGDQIVLLARNLPSFTTFTDLGGGNGQLVFNPTRKDRGLYSGIEFTARDNYLNESTKVISILVTTDEYDELVLVNFSNGSLSLPHWNDVINLNQPVTNLVNANNNSSNIHLTFSGWAANGADGYKTGGDKGRFSDGILKTYWNSTTTGNISLENLDPTKVYNVNLLCSSTNVWDSITYNINSVSYYQGTAFNKDNLITFAGLVPDGNGKIALSISKYGYSSTYPTNNTGVYLTSMTIGAYDPVKIIAPSDLITHAISKDQIELSWTDNSGNETGFEIYRRMLPGGVAQFLTLLPANSTSYNNTGLLQNTSYQYQVRAVDGSKDSKYSNTSTCSTLDFSININFNEVASGSPSVGNPWNDTNSEPTSAIIWQNLKNDTWNTTAIDLYLEYINGVITVNTGATTGNNSGVYPDNVMKSYYFVEGSADFADYIIQELDPTYEYNLTFFGSEDGSAVSNNDLLERFSLFISNGDTVYLNNQDNVSKTVTIYGIIPDQNNEIKFRHQSSITSRWGMLNAMVIQAYKPEQSNESEFNFEYFAKKNTDISAPANWFSKRDGTGFSPTSFNDDGISYIITNSSSASLNSSLDISGIGSVLHMEGGNAVNISSATDTLTANGMVVNGTDSVIIVSPSPSVVNIGSKGLKIIEGGTLNIGDNHLTVNGGINSVGEKGKLKASNGDITINYASPEESNLYFADRADSLNNLLINVTGGGPVNLHSRLNLRNILDIQAGSFNTNDSLVLVSVGNYTGKIAKVGAGCTINGKVAIQRQIVRSQGGFYLIGTSIKDQTILDWQDDFFLQGIPSSYPSAWSNAYFQDESTNRFVSITSDNQPVDRGIGIGVYLYNSNFTDDGQVVFQNYGYPIIGDGADTQGGAAEKFSFNVSYNTSDPDPTNAGWNLIANPYPCEINWNLLNWTTPGSDLTNMSSAVYLYDGQNMQFVPWNHELGTDLNIASGQAFYVKAIGANPVLNISEDIKITTGATFMRKEDNKPENLFVEITDSNNRKDKTVIGFRDYASANYEGMIDALKLEGTSVNIFTESVDGKDLAINMEPSYKSNILTIPLILSNQIEGNNIIDVHGYENLSSSPSLFLVDNYLDKVERITSDFEYHFIISSDTNSFSRDRFLLVNYPKVSISLSDKKARKNSYVRIPVAIDQLKDIEAGRIEFEWDSNVLVFSKVGRYSRPLKQLSEFSYGKVKNGNLGFSWQGDIINSFIADSNNLFTLVFRVIGQYGDSTQVLVNDENSSFINSIGQDVGFHSQGGKVRVRSLRKIKFHLQSVDGHGLAHISLKNILDNTEIFTDDSGDALYNIEAGKGNEIRLLGHIGNAPEVDVTSLYRVKKMLLNESKMSTEELAAADMNQSGGLTALDVAMFRRQILTQDASGIIGKYVFMKDDKYLGDTYSVNDTLYDIDENLTGVVLGDLHQYSGYLRKENSGLKLKYEFRQDQLSGEVILSIKPEVNIPLLGYQFTISLPDKFDEEQIRDISGYYNILKVNNHGKMTVLWTTEDGKAKSFDQDGFIDILLKPSQMPGDFSLDKSKNYPSLAIDESEGIRTMDFLDISNGKFKIIEAVPNPFTYDVQLILYNQEEEKCEFVITNSIGKTIYSEKVFLQQGVNKLTWNGRNNAGMVVNTGLYICTISKNGGQSSIKVLKE